MSCGNPILPEVFIYLERSQRPKELHLAERQLTLDLLMTPAHLAAAARLAAAHPETLTIINHLAKPSMRNADFAAWSQGLAAFGRLEQVACKLSGFLTFDRFPATATRLAPYTDAAFETFGASRMLFGSDWPVSVLGGGYAAAVSLAEDILAPLSETERAEVWSGTARRVYPALDRTVSHQTGPRL